MEESEMDIEEATDIVLAEMGLNEMPSSTSLDPATLRMRRQVATRIGEKVRESNRINASKRVMTKSLEDFI